MRNDIRKKAIALLLSVVMTAGMVPAPVFALNGARDQAPLSEDVYEPAGGGSDINGKIVSHNESPSRPV